MWTIHKKQSKNTKFKDTGNSLYVYQNELDQACFVHYMAYRDLKDLTKRTSSDEIVRDKAFNIPKNPKYDGYQRGVVLIVYKFFEKKLLLMVLKNTIPQTKN